MFKTAFAATLLFLLSLADSASVSAQYYKPHFGIKGGLNYSNLRIEDADKTETTTGFNVGTFANIPITGFLSIQPEFYYTTKGASVTYNNIFADGTASFTSNYLEVPLLLVLNLTNKFSFHTGPFVSYMISGKVTNSSNVTLFDFENNINPEDYNRFETGWATGIEYDFGLLGLGARYNYGMTKVGKEKTFNGTKYTFPDGENAVLNFYLTLSI